MSEWSVVLVIVTLVGLGAAIMGPIVSLTKSITTLTVAVDNLKETNERLWKHEEKQDTQLDDHEKRLIKVEGK